AGSLSRGRVRPEFVSALAEFGRREPRLTAQLHFSFYLNNPNPFALEFIRNLPVSTTVSVGLTHEQCDVALLSADVLLDIAADADSPLLMTKLATYVGLPRPVWAVCKPGGTSWNLVERGWGYASDAASREGIQGTLRQICADWSAGALWRRHAPAQIKERFTAQRHIADLLSLCKHVSAPDSRLSVADWPDSLKTDWP